MFSQVLVAVVRKSERHKHDRVLVTYNTRGQIVRGTYTIPEGDHPIVYVPLFEFQRTVRGLKLNTRTKMSDEEKRQHQRDSLARHRARKKAQGVAVERTTRPRVLSDAEVVEIRALKAQGYKNTEIARMKSVSDSLVSKIVNNRRRTGIAA